MLKPFQEGQGRSGWRQSYVNSGLEQYGEEKQRSQDQS